jgi:two-component sensor histidine kinase
MSIGYPTGQDRQRFERRTVSHRNAGATHAATIAELNAALQREEDLLRERDELSRRQALLAEEFEHRLVNGLQLIVSLLTLQSRAATTIEGAQQLIIARDRVAAIARVHRRLHVLDHEKSVELKPYLQGLCDDLSGMLLQKPAALTIVVSGAEVRLPTSMGIPLGFIVNELITNSVKHAEGHITVKIDTSAATHSLSVMDDGPGFPADFKPADTRGLGMKIIQSLTAQIGGTLQFASGERGRGARATVTFAVAPR